MHYSLSAYKHVCVEQLFLGQDKAIFPLKKAVEIKKYAHTSATHRPFISMPCSNSCTLKNITLSLPETRYIWQVCDSFTYVYEQLNCQKVPSQSQWYDESYSDIKTKKTHVRNFLGIDLRSGIFENILLIGKDLLYSVVYVLTYRFHSLQQNYWSILFSNINFPVWSLSR